MQGRRNTQARKELTTTLKQTGILNYQESKKLGSSVDKFQKEFEQKVKDLSMQQSLLRASQQKRDSRRASLPSSPTFELLCDEESRRGNRHALKNSFSDSSIFRCAFNRNAVVKEKGMKLDAKTGATQSTRLKLPNILNKQAGKERDAKLIEIQEIPFSSFSDKNIDDKPVNLRQAKPNPKLGSLDMTGKLSSGYSALITASPPTMRTTRRGSIQVSPLAIEESATNSRSVIRRGSCPNLGSKWEITRKHFLGLDLKKNNSDDKESTFARQVQEMKKCRYLRFPKSIIEDDEEDTDIVLTNK